MRLPTWRGLPESLATNLSRTASSVRAHAIGGSCTASRAMREARSGAASAPRPSISAVQPLAARAARASSTHQISPLMRVRASATGATSGQRAGGR